MFFLTKMLYIYICVHILHTMFMYLFFYKPKMFCFVCKAFKHIYIYIMLLMNKHLGCFRFYKQQCNWQLDNNIKLLCCINISILYHIFNQKSSVFIILFLNTVIVLYKRYTICLSMRAARILLLLIIA